MKALSLWQPWASLVALGVKSIETRSWSTSYRGPLAIHAAKRKPGDGTVYGDCAVRYVDEAPRLRRLTPDPNEPARWSVDVPLPLGAVVATCTLVDVVPMESLSLCIDVGARGWAIQQLGHVPLVDPDQRPYGDYSEGRYAWLLDDIKPTTERCPRCWGTGDHEQTDPITDKVIDEDLRMPCTRCDGEGVCGPIPAKGRQQLWEWAAA